MNCNNCNCKNSDEEKDCFDNNCPEEENPCGPIQDPIEIINRATNDLINVYKSKQKVAIKNFKHKKKAIEGASKEFADEIKPPMDKWFSAIKDIFNS